MIYIKEIVNEAYGEGRQGYPYDIPAVRALDRLEFGSDVTFFVGENGSGKSTIVEALAICAGFNPEGGSIFMNHHTYDTHSQLFENFRVVRGARRNRDGYFLRAESFYNIASETDRISSKAQLERNYNGALHARSHGESFMSVVENRLSGNGLYIFDEPESALSITNQLRLMKRMKELVDQGSQFIIATHSPILLAYPGATVYSVSDSGLTTLQYEETDHYRLMKYFVSNHEDFLSELLGMGLGV